MARIQQPQLLVITVSYLHTTPSLGPPRVLSSAAVRIFEGFGYDIALAASTAESDQVLLTGARPSGAGEDTPASALGYHRGALCATTSIATPRALSGAAVRGSVSLRYDIACSV